MRGVHARASVERDARNEGGSLSRLAPSVTRMAICVSRILLDGLQKKERLLVAYRREELITIFLCCLCWVIINKPLYSAGDTSIQGTLAMVPRVSPE